MADGRPTERVERGDLLARPDAGAERSRPDELLAVPGRYRLSRKLGGTEPGRIGRDDAALARFLGAIEGVVRSLEERDRVILCAQLCHAGGQEQLPALAERT